MFSVRQILCLGQNTSVEQKILQETATTTLSLFLELFAQKFSKSLKLNNSCTPPVFTRVKGELTNIQETLSIKVEQLALSLFLTQEINLSLQIKLE